MMLVPRSTFSFTPSPCWDYARRLNPVSASHARTIPGTMNAADWLNLLSGIEKWSKQR
ncbi:MAG: hypothetical protein M5U34_40600 [Chloroflexi bacterium]|nr:hypothetical protein [Chloroflexota bacterium]